MLFRLKARFRDFSRQPTQAAPRSFHTFACAPARQGRLEQIGSRRSTARTDDPKLLKLFPGQMKCQQKSSSRHLRKLRPCTALTTDQGSPAAEKYLRRRKQTLLLLTGCFESH